MIEIYSMLSRFGNTSAPVTLTGNTIILNGDSIGTGYAATVPINVNGWVYKFASDRGYTLINYSVSGKTLEAGNTCGYPYLQDSEIPVFIEGTHRYYIIALGVNDISFNNGTHTVVGYSNRMTAAINTLLAQGWTKQRIVIVNTYYFTQAGRDSYIGSCGTVQGTMQRYLDYVNAANTVAAANQVILYDVNTLMSTYSTPANLLISDGIHPNMLGHDLIRTGIEALLT